MPPENFRAWEQVTNVRGLDQCTRYSLHTYLCQHPKDVNLPSLPQPV